MSLVLIVLVILLLCGGGWGFHSGAWGGSAGYGHPLGIVLFVLLVMVLLGGFLGPWHHYY